MTATKDDWLKANEKVQQIEATREALLEPTQVKYDAACEALELIEEHCGDLIARCETCMEPIFDGDTLRFDACAVDEPVQRPGSPAIV